MSQIEAVKAAGKALHTVLSKQRRQEMIRLTTNERLPIIEDDVYGDLWFEEKTPPPI
ncbi:hypothetical protein GXP75_04095 [Bacillus sp. HU-1818]|nr:Transcriptional regulator, GntR family domain [Bacillus atrophaeus]MCI3194872.1 hypothetical protein [Bacillus sp. HU-1818]